jgi:hypothetical protein
MIAFESLERRDLLSVVVTIANTETVQITDADVVDIIEPPVYGELALDQPNNQLDYVWGGDDTDHFIYSPGWPEEEVDVILTPPNNSPAAIDDLYVTRSNAHLKVKAVDGVLANDLVPENDALADLVVDVFPVHGRLTMRDDGGFSYKPDRHYVGSDSFSYTVSSTITSPDRSNPANVSIIVGDTIDAYDYYFAEVINQTAKRKTSRVPLYVNYYGWQM